MAYKVISTQTIGNKSVVIGFWDTGTSLITQRTYPVGYSEGGSVFPPPLGTEFINLPELPVSIGAGATVSRITQDVQAGGKVANQIWQLSNGAEVSHTYEYGPNSNSIPTSVIRGTGDKVPVLSNFRTNSAGDRILFLVQNTPLTKTTGILTGWLNGVIFNRDLTFSASGSVIISGAALTAAAYNLTVDLAVFPLARSTNNFSVQNLVGT